MASDPPLNIPEQPAALKQHYTEASQMPKGLLKQLAHEMGQAMVDSIKAKHPDSNPVLYMDILQMPVFRRAEQDGREP